MKADYKAFIDTLLNSDVTNYVDNRIEPPGSEVSATYPKIIVFPVTERKDNLHGRSFIAYNTIQIDIRSKDIEEVENITDIMIDSLLKDNLLLNVAKIKNVALQTAVSIFEDPIHQKSLRFSFSKIEVSR
ncbi:MAG: hypothetical protein HXS43_11985 [Theionarchaea archaeon]|nr:hypothetical protein [Theionarchaea archaeon]